MPPGGSAFTLREETKTLLYPGEMVRLLHPLPERGLPQYSEGRVAEVRRGPEGEPLAVEVEFYRESRAEKAEVPFEAVEPVIASTGLERTAVLWALEKTPEQLIEAAMHFMLDRGFLMRDGLNVARLYYDGDERWWKWGEKLSDATGAHVATAAAAWDGCVVAFSGQQRFHLEFRLQGRGEATVLLHERDAAFREQARSTEPAMSLARVLMNLWGAIGARYCAFPVAHPWLADEDWRSLLRPPLYPDFLLLPETSLPEIDPSYRVIKLSGNRVMATVLPVKGTPQDDPIKRSDRDLKVDSLRKCKALGEKYYEQMYESRFGTTGLYADTKDAFYDAISAANELGMKEEAEKLSERLHQIKAVFRSQFS